MFNVNHKIANNKKLQLTKTIDIYQYRVQILNLNNFVVQWTRNCLGWSTELTSKCKNIIANEHRGSLSVTRVTLF